MNLYEITDTKTGKVIEPVIALKEAAERINCKPYLVQNAYYGGYLVKHRYRIRLVDETVKRKDTIWIEWDVYRRWILKLCRRDE